jgi:hypothetical protein
MQQLNLTPGALFALFIVALLILGSYWFMRGGERRRSNRTVTPSRSESTASSKGTSPSAQSLRAELRRLHKASAGWTEILPAVNPSGSASIATDLQAIRGPHMFAPGLAIQVLEEGCNEAIKQNPNATVAQAVQLARKSMEKVTRYGD